MDNHRPCKHWYKDHSVSSSEHSQAQACVQAEQNIPSCNQKHPQHLTGSPHTKGITQVYTYIHTLHIHTYIHTVCTVWWHLCNLRLSNPTRCKLPKIRDELPVSEFLSIFTFVLKNLGGLISFADYPKHCAAFSINHVQY